MTKFTIIKLYSCVFRICLSIFIYIYVWYMEDIYYFNFQCFIRDIRGDTLNFKVIYLIDVSYLWAWLCNNVFSKCKTFLL